MLLEHSLVECALCTAVIGVAVRTGVRRVHKRAVNGISSGLKNGEMPRPGHRTSA